MKARLTTLTPIHIGSGQTLNKNMDFAQEGDKIGFLNLEKIVNLIGIENIDQLTSTIEQNESLIRFLREGKSLSHPLSEFSTSISKVMKISSSTTQLKEHYKTTLKGVCIPGSSLKGAIKTSIWDELLDKKFLNNLRIENLRNRKGNWVDLYVDQKLFGENANEKTTRFLKPGDIHFPNTQTEIHESIIINQRYNNWVIKKRNSFLIECIPADSSAEFNFILDEKLLELNKNQYPNKFPNKNISILKDINTLCQIINKYTQAILEWELESLEQRYFSELPEGQIMLNEYDRILNRISKLKDSEFIIRIGANSGWRFMTGGWADEAIDDNRDYDNLRRTIQRKSYDDDVMLPKTRKTNSEGIPFGFALVSIKPN